MVRLRASCDRGLSKSSKGTVAEIALESLTLLLSNGALHLAQPIPDDRRIDRLVYRPSDGRTIAVQVKSAEPRPRDRYLNVSIVPPAPTADVSRSYVFVCTLAPRSPWIADGFWIIPMTALGPVPRSGAWRFAPPIDPRAPTKWARYHHHLADLPAVLTRALNRGLSPLERRRVLARPPPQAGLSSTAKGLIMENESANLISVTSGGALHILRPRTDDFGDDFAVMSADRDTALWLQVKGSMTVDRGRWLAVKVEARTFRKSAFNVVLILEYRPAEYSHGPFVWLIRTDELARLVPLVGGAYHFRANADPAARDKLRPWRYSADEIAAALSTALGVVEREGGEAMIPTRRDEVLAARRHLG